VQFNGRYYIPAPPEVVWAALNDVEVLKASIPNCQSISKPDPEHVLASAKLKIGPVSATFGVSVTLAEMDPPKRCILRGEGQGGVAGFARGEAEVILTPQEDGTVLTYAAKANVGGKLAQIGQRLIDGAAKQIADDFFARFSAAAAAWRSQIAAPPKPEISAPVPAARADDATPPVREGLAPEIWVIGLIAVVVVLLIVFGVAFKP
jgi:carbon monoxide dehydrogenase subunit G